MNSNSLNPTTLDLVEKRAKELMDKYHGCAQCVHVAIQEFSGLKDEGAIKAISGFSGGFGGIQSMCGALTGAGLALGMKYGRDASYLEGPAEEAMKKQFEVMEQVARLAKWFEREYGSIYCNELRKKYMGTELGDGNSLAKRVV